MNIEQVITYLDEKIEELEMYAIMRTNDMPENITIKIDEIKDRTVKVIEDVKAKVEDTSKKVIHDEAFINFLEEVTVKCDSATNYTKTKIDEAIDFSKHDERLKEASEQIKNAFDEIKNNEEVKEMVSSIKEVSATIYKQIEDYMSKPETKVAIDKAKKSTIKIAEKGVSALKNLLKVEE